MSLKNASIKAAIVLIPSYSIAYLTEQMVYVVPMLAATSFFAGTIDLRDSNIRRRVDEDGETPEEESEMSADVSTSNSHVVGPHEGN